MGEWVGEGVDGVEKSLGALLPVVAAMDGDAGGSVERVKYTTLANEPPTYSTAKRTLEHRRTRMAVRNIHRLRYARQAQCGSGGRFLCCLLSGSWLQC